MMNDSNRKTSRTCQVVPGGKLPFAAATLCSLSALTSLSLR